MPRKGGATALPVQDYPSDRNDLPAGIVRWCRHSLLQHGTTPEHSPCSGERRALSHTLQPDCFVPEDDSSRPTFEIGPQPSLGLRVTRHAPHHTLDRGCSAHSYCLAALPSGTRRQLLCRPVRPHALPCAEHPGSFPRRRTPAQPLL